MTDPKQTAMAAISKIFSDLFWKELKKIFILLAAPIFLQYYIATVFDNFFANIGKELDLQIYQTSKYKDRYFTKNMILYNNQMNLCDKNATDTQ